MKRTPTLLPLAIAAFAAAIFVVSTDEGLDRESSLAPEADAIPHGASEARRAQTADSIAANAQAPTPMAGADAQVESDNATAEAPDWPQEGSTVSYTMTTTWSARGIERVVQSNATWTYASASWSARCEGEFDTEGSADESVRSGSFSRRWNGDDPHHHPPHAESMTTLRRAAPVTVWTPQECRMTPEALRDAGTVRAVLPLADEDENVTVDARRLGTPSSPFGGGPHAHASYWHPGTGLLLAWDLEVNGWHTRGRLTHIDAPDALASR